MDYENMSREELSEVLSKKMKCKINPSWNCKTLRYLIEQGDKIVEESENNSWKIDSKKFKEFITLSASRIILMVILSLILRYFLN